MKATVLILSCFTLLSFSSEAQTFELKDDYIPRGYLISSSVLTGTGIGYSAIGFGQLKYTDPNWVYPAIGMANGATQLTLGFLYYNRTFGLEGDEVTFQRNQHLSLANIGIGSLTTLFNSYVLFKVFNQNENTNHSSQISLFSFPTDGHGIAAGIRITKQL